MTWSASLKIAEGGDQEPLKVNVYTTMKIADVDGKHFDVNNH